MFDPSLAQANGDTKIWMSYSSVDPSVQWPSQNPQAVSTRLAYSTDQGATWADGGAVNSFQDVTIALAPPNNAGTWVNEVADLVYDPAAAASERWKLMWHHYLILNNVRHLDDHSWIGLKMAAAPEQLAAATEIKLFSAYGYNTANNTQGGSSQSPLGGAPAIALDTVDAGLSGCIFTEPGMLATSSALYVSMLCAKTPTSHLIALFKCSSPCNVTNAASWSYLGSALSDADASALGYNEGFSATNLVASGGQNYLIVTPVSTTPFDSYYNGCRVYRFADIDTASLQRSGGVPTPVTSANGSAGSFNGACTYLPGASKAGILYSELVQTPAIGFKVFSSGINF